MTEREDGTALGNIVTRSAPVNAIARRAETNRLAVVPSDFSPGRVDQVHRMARTISAAFQLLAR
ncbi:hypothetical protein [Rhizobium sp. 1399]|uniref:hypothetical protein n=1 Tax=Rhizobium sp. 1399 TaxID=2817758 RepID=UPI002855DBBF|nr:hypothetical protein [Rhizobium sp. 1399]MDR6667871.1 hypothetical protein [Rhizobium sp. 1399]